MSFRQVEQRHVSSEIHLMEWSPTMDLIALTTAQGEVLLHRLSWQKVWSLPPQGSKDEDIKITAISWRPDGKVLALAYDKGYISLVDVENSETLHKLEIGCVVSSLKWIGNAKPGSTHFSLKTCSTCDSPKPAFYVNKSSQFLPKSYGTNKGFSPSSKLTDDNPEDSKKLKGVECMNILVVGTEEGCVQLYAFGMFPCTRIKIPSCSENPVRVLSASLSDDLSLISMLLQETDSNEKMSYCLKSIGIPVLKSRVQEFKIVALKYGLISSLLSYLANTIRHITEAWEDILLEIDTKLWKYAEDKKQVSGGTVSDDFLELLMFGTPSDSLEKFLLHDLTENGLKKFGHSIELSYSNIQKLVLKKLQNIATALFYHLSDLKGISEWQERFGDLGLSVDAVNQAMSEVGSFLMKATEIQQVIDSSMKNFKAFFRWLYAVILRLSDEPVPPEITKVTQQDLNFVAEFLKENFASEWDSEKSKSTFKLERVGQYLKNEDLPFPPNVSDNPWLAFLRKHPDLQNDSSIYAYQPNKSLVQQHEEVKKVVEKAFEGTWDIFHNSVIQRRQVPLHLEDKKLNLKISHITGIHTEFMYTLFTEGSVPCKYVYLIRERLATENAIEGVRLFFGQLPIDLPSSFTETEMVHRICDVMFYNDDTVSLLLQECNSPSSLSQDTKADCCILLQLPLKAIHQEMKPLTSMTQLSFNTLDGSQYVDKMNYKRLENFRAVELAVSGTRKVSCILFSSRRQVRLFEIDVDDEDEDQDDTEHEDSIMKDLSNPDESVIDMEEVSNGDKENTP